MRLADLIESPIGGFAASIECLATGQNPLHMALVMRNGVENHINFGLGP